jgi:hypothetical protein
MILLLLLLLLLLCGFGKGISQLHCVGGKPCRCSQLEVR